MYDTDFQYLRLITLTLADTSKVGSDGHRVSIVEENDLEIRR
jgi:hypothetical protein